MDIWEKLYLAAKEQYHPEEVSPFIYAHHVVCAVESENGEIYVGNPDAVTIAEWVNLCYDAVGAELETVSVEGHPQRAYFCFHDYDYYLDVTKQAALMPDVKPLAEGLRESYEWFRQHRDAVMRRPYWEYVEENLK